MKKHLRIWPIGLVILGTVVVLAAQQPVQVVNNPLTVQPGNTANTTPWLMQVRDAAGNARGANVDSSNRLAVIADINNPGAVVTDAATQATGVAAMAYVTSTALQYDSIGSNYARQYLDPCQSAAKSYATVNQTSNTQILGAAGSSKNYYICSVQLMTTTPAQTVAMVDSATAGNACATSPEAIDGITASSAATGWPFGANGGLSYGNGGFAVGKTHSTNAALCVMQGSSGQVSGGFSYVVR